MVVGGEIDPAGSDNALDVYDKDKRPLQPNFAPNYDFDRMPKLVSFHFYNRPPGVITIKTVRILV